MKIYNYKDLVICCFVLFLIVEIPVIDETSEQFQMDM